MTDCPICADIVGSVPPGICPATHELCDRQCFVVCDRKVPRSSIIKGPE